MFTQLAYNTRDHSRTRFTPLELLTGINTYPFEDYTGKEISLLANSVTLSRLKLLDLKIPIKQT